MKTDNFFAIKIKVERILIVILFLFSSILFILHVDNKSEIKQLKSEVNTQQSLIFKLNSKIKNIENQNDDLESRINDLENKFDQIVIYRY
jgi:cell division protein FtsB